VVQPEGEPGDGDGHGAGNVDCVPLANEKQDIAPPTNERRELTALWKENQETVTVMEQGT
jgi:hypothetical protein